MESSQVYQNLESLSLAPFLKTFFNKCIAQSDFTENFKTAAVPFIFKITTPKSFNDFCLILLLPILSKMLEKIIIVKK